MRRGNRQKAKEKGEKFYSSDKKCPQGHDSVRLTSNGRCYQCSNEQRLEWDKENKDWKDEWIRNNPNKRKSCRLKTRYGISYEEYLSLLREQDNRCAICQSQYSGTELYDCLVVDHCHETNKVRGLLCFNCNIALGKLRDDPVLLERALSYVKK